MGREQEANGFSVHVGVPSQQGSVNRGTGREQHSETVNESEWALRVALCVSSPDVFK